MCQIKSSQIPCRHRNIRDDILTLLGHIGKTSDDQCPLNCSNICELDTLSMGGRHPIDDIPAEEILEHLTRKTFVVHSLEEAFALSEKKRIRFPVRIDPVDTPEYVWGAFERGPFIKKNAFFLALDMALIISPIGEATIKEIPEECGEETS